MYWWISHTTSKCPYHHTKVNNEYHTYQYKDEQNKACGKVIRSPKIYRWLIKLLGIPAMGVGPVLWWHAVHHVPMYCAFKARATLHIAT